MPRSQHRFLAWKIIYFHIIYEQQCVHQPLLAGLVVSTMDKTHISAACDESPLWPRAVCQVSDVHWTVQLSYFLYFGFALWKRAHAALGAGCFTDIHQGRSVPQRTSKCSAGQMEEEANKGKKEKNLPWSDTKSLQKWRRECTGVLFPI